MRGPGFEAGARPAATQGFARRVLHQVLCVEDDADIRAVLQLALVRIGRLEVICCGSGEEALEAVPRLLPDLVLLDLMMPGIDGIETLRRLKADPATALVPVVLTSARLTSEHRMRFRELGAIGVIAKPFDPLRLACELKAIHAAGD